jgi:transposase
MQMKALQLYYYLQAKLFLNTYKNFNLLSVKMAPSKKEAQQKTILHFWEQGIRNAAEIHSKTKIPLRTIYNNLKKLKESGDIKRKSGSGRTKKITPRASRSIGQLIRRQPTISTKSIASKLKDVFPVYSFKTFG